MKFIYSVLILLILFGCQPKDSLDFININNMQNKEITTIDKTEIQEKSLHLPKEKKIAVSKVKKENTNSQEQFLYSKLYINFKSLKYYSKIKITYSEKIKVGIKPNVLVNFNFKSIYRKKSLASYNLFFSYKNNISPIKITNYLNYNISLIPTLYGLPDYVRREVDLFTWQYRYKNCVVDHFFKKDQNKILYTVVRSINLKLELNKKNCLKEIKKKILN